MIGFSSLPINLKESNQIESNTSKRMEKFDANEPMVVAEAYVGSVVDAIYRRLMKRKFALDDPELVNLIAEWTKIPG